MRVLFVCSRNRLRSPTAEQHFSKWPGLEVSSAGLSPDAEEQLTAEDVADAELILVMEKRHEKLLKERFSRFLQGKKVACLRIPDEFDFMQPELVELLEARTAPYLAAFKPL
ncbi:MAG TPA: phosphotyrosine protein phosphatase [Myxococcota bacterium]|nr:phosphotyrosine protein phosphatase [Myxococcota bacterium]HNH47311.1 phosphotyrosine protein phosphatase [Myxococcota bacterium]